MMWEDRVQILDRDAPDRPTWETVVVTEDKDDANETARRYRNGGDKVRVLRFRVD